MRPKFSPAWTFTFNFVPRYVDGIVPASWSIGVEMVFYFLFPVILVFARNIIGSIFVLVLSLFVAGQSYMDFTAAKELNPSFIYHGFLSAIPYFALRDSLLSCFCIPEANHTNQPTACTVTPGMGLNRNRRGLVSSHNVLLPVLFVFLEVRIASDLGLHLEHSIRVDLRSHEPGPMTGRRQPHRRARLGGERLPLEGQCGRVPARDDESHVVR